MKKNIHPQCQEVTATCSCGNIVKVVSTVNHSLNLDVCNQCHSFFTGKHRIINTGGRIERFNKRFNL